MRFPKKIFNVPIIFTFIAFTLVITMWYLGSYFQSVRTHIRSFHRIFIQPVPSPAYNVTLLAWTPFFSSSSSFYPKNMEVLKCPHHKCLFTNSRSELCNSDVVLFHWRDLNPQDLPEIRNVSTKWLLFNYESPPHSPWSTLESVISKMNLVVSYRSDSDIVDTYGYVNQRQASDPVDVHDITLKDFQTKNAVVWVVSNCETHSKREDYVRQLKKYIDVTIYGKCGSTSRCGGISAKNCLEELGNTFKFYLAFENSICVDYATEKVFIPLMTGMVPVVFGGANYSDILPPNSYINALDFDSPKDLAGYLKTVDSNFTLYKRYHEWRNIFVVTDGLSSFKWLCKLCNFIHEDFVSDATKNKVRFHRWWYDSAKCRKYSVEKNTVVLV